jgi:hypothetical protein
MDPLTALVFTLALRDPDRQSVSFASGLLPSFEVRFPFAPGRFCLRFQGFPLSFLPLQQDERCHAFLSRASGFVRDLSVDNGDIGG